MQPKEIEFVGFYVSYLFAILAVLGYPSSYSNAVNLFGALLLRKVDSRSECVAITVCVVLALYLNACVIATTPYLSASVLCGTSIVVILERYVGVGAISVVRVFSS